MNATYWEIAVSDAAYATLGAFVGGLVIAGALVWAVRLGIRVRRREPDRPKAHEQPTLPESGPTYESREVREPNEVPHADEESDRLTPHQLGGSGTKRSEKQERSRWGSGSGGSFGSGGPGNT
ncbi:DUF6479 family protein [Streptomyces sp. NPDC005808]|uniref:DUF6479 family protein n=1 Tax=Streptomyces sp. NPDC005808 TaxID=3364734 RepID=UPI0036C3522B